MGAGEPPAPRLAAGSGILPACLDLPTHHGGAARHGARARPLVDAAWDAAHHRWCGRRSVAGDATAGRLEGRGGAGERPGPPAWRHDRRDRPGRSPALAAVGPLQGVEVVDEPSFRPRLRFRLRVVNHQGSVAIRKEFGRDRRSLVREVDALRRVGDLQLPVPEVAGGERRGRHPGDRAFSMARCCARRSSHGARGSGTGIDDAGVARRSLRTRLAGHAPRRWPSAGAWSARSRTKRTSRPCSMWCERRIVIGCCSMTSSTAT